MKGPYVHVEKDGRASAASLMLLHPLPHSGTFFDTFTPMISKNRQVLRPDYPGFGRSDPSSHPPSIENFAAAIIEATIEHAPLDLLGFHTGCLVGAELALTLGDAINRLILIDVPCFDESEAAEMARAVANSDKYNAQAVEAFRGAFSYPSIKKFQQLSNETMVIATASRLRDPTLRAAKLIPRAGLSELPQVRAPAFENGALDIHGICDVFLRGQ